MIHELKTWPEYYEAIKSGAKKFEYRKNDRNYKVGDHLELREYDPATNSYTPNDKTEFILCHITYILDVTSYGYLEYPYVIMSIESKVWKRDNGLGKCAMCIVSDATTRHGIMEVCEDCLDIINTYFEEYK